MDDEGRNCSFDEDGRWFRLRACAVILHDDAVLMARNDVDHYAYSIGGGILHGESAEDAVRREVREETGLDLEIDRLLFVHENFFTDSSPLLAGRECHEVAFYFLMRYDGEAISSGSTTSHGIPEQCVWIPLDDYGRTGPAYPEFFAEELRALPAATKHIVTHEKKR